MTAPESWQYGAIRRSRERRRVELAPLRSAVADEIERLGWRTAKPLVVEIMAPLRIVGPRGGWWSAVGKRQGPRLLEALRETPAPPRQQRFPLGRTG
ncbi:MAG: hypothetical protein ACRDZ6_02345 [Acidimicrobiales bacterium]